MKSLPFVKTSSEAIDNIRAYEGQLRQSQGLQRILAQSPAWYAAPSGKKGLWVMAPSKFVGYYGIKAESYLSNNGATGDHDGRETERLLEPWFQPVAIGSALHRQLHAQLSDLLQRYGKTPNKRARFKFTDGDTKAHGTSAVLSARSETLIDTWITFDPNICGGKPTLTGTRIRVTDVLELLAAGDTAETLLADYPSLKRDHITSALTYAALSVDHRVIRAA
ncbi:MAG: DUF433 domain-containing protein [Beijerinckiaceae bacterium]